MAAEMQGQPDWRAQVYARLKEAGVELFIYLPDAGIDPFARMAEADNEVETVVTTTEEECVGICCGAWLGGKKSVVMMQSSGVGNCLNAFALITNCQFPVLALVSMRGEFGEVQPWQIAMGGKTQQALELGGFHVFRATRQDEVSDLVAGAATMVWGSDQAVAVLLSQRLVGAKKFTKG